MCQVDQKATHKLLAERDIYHVISACSWDQWQKAKKDFGSPVRNRFLKAKVSNTMRNFNNKWKRTFGDTHTHTHTKLLCLCVYVCERIICTKNICDVTAWCQGGGRAGRPTASLTRISMLQSMAGRHAHLTEVSDTLTFPLLTHIHTHTRRERHSETLCLQLQSRVHNACTNIGVVWHTHTHTYLCTYCSTYPNFEPQARRHGSRFPITQRATI